MAKILLVEDAAELAEAIRRELTVDDHCVQTAFDGKETLAQSQQSPPDLVLLNWMLSEQEDYSGLRQIPEGSHGSC
ncbi:MAG: response regulator [Chloroflexota bacterium]|nr:response regulator [Chloroflexota bacterium]